MKVLVRVPEGYLIVRPYRTTRPALLVIDADGRRVDSIKLLQADKRDVAARLREAAKAPALEHIEISGADVRLAVAGIEGVRDVVQEGDRLIVTAEAGALPPAKLKALDQRVVIHHPLPVRIGKQSALPGTWYRDGDTAHVARLLLHPPKGVRTDLEVRAFSLPNVPRGGLGARVAMAPYGVKGVLSVFPDIFNDKQVVVGRMGEVDWKGVRKAFEKAGCNAQPLPAK